MTLSAFAAPNRNPHNSRHSNPRLEPIDKPRSIKLKIVYWLAKKRLGKVITPLKVHTARFPEGLGLSLKILRTEERISIDPKLKHLIKVYVATLNGCLFCVDIGKASAKTKKLNTVIFDDLLQFEESPHFRESEKSALAFVDETTRNRQISDATFERVQRYFTEKEIVEITCLNAIENFYNLMNAPLNIGSDELCATIGKLG